MNVDFFGNDDDGYESVVIPNGYQQANQPPQCADVEWDWFQEIDDDLWIAELAPGPVGPNALPRIFDEPPWDWTQDEDEPPTQIDYDPGAIEIDNNPIITIEDAFDWSAQDDDEQAPLDDYQGAAVAPVAQPMEDAFDWSGQDEDDQAPLDESVPAAVVSTTQYFGDDAEQLDEAIEPTILPAGFQQADVVVIAASQFFEEPFDWEDSPPDYMADDFGNDDADPPVADAWDWSHQDDDEQAVPDDPIGADVATNPVQFYEDGGDLWTQDADDDTFAALDSDPVGASVAAVVAQITDDPWDWSDQDAFAEESWQLIVDDDDDAISTDAPSTPFDDAWDWSQEADDQEFSESVSTDLPIAAPFEDAWDWISGDLDNDFEWALEPNALIASIPIPPSQFTDDAWDWTEWIEVEDGVDEGFWIFFGGVTPRPKFNAARERSKFIADNDHREFIAARDKAKFWPV